MVFAMLLLIVTVPAHAFALRLPWHPGGETGRGRPDREVLTSRTFLLLAGSGTLASLATYASLVNLVPLLLHHGAARGLLTLVGATVVSDHWGSQRYAALNGVYHAPIGIAAALAPAFGAGVAAITGSYAALFGVLALIALVGAALAASAGVPSVAPPNAELVE